MLEVFSFMTLLSLVHSIEGIDLIGIILYQTGNYKEALEIYQKGIPIAEQLENQLQQLHQGEFNKGN